MFMVFIFVMNGMGVEVEQGEVEGLENEEHEQYSLLNRDQVINFLYFKIKFKPI